MELASVAWPIGFGGMPGEIRILIVEDSPTQAKKLQILLESQMFEVEVANDGDQGLERFLASEFDIVISDVVMPGMSGFELCERIRKHPTKAAVPVVLLTAQQHAEDRIRGMSAGAASFITKPYNEEDLVQHIIELVTGIAEASCLNGLP